MGGTDGVFQHLPSPCVVRTRSLSLSRKSRRPQKEDRKPSDREQIALIDWLKTVAFGRKRFKGEGDDAVLHDTVHVALRWTDVQFLL